MTSFIRRNLFALTLAVMVIGLLGSSVVFAQDNGNGVPQFVRARIVAVGIPGASTVSPVGVFLPGGPIHDKPALHAFTQPGQVLDPVRILVGSSSNFGASLARTDEMEGSVLSIDPTSGNTLSVPADFASAGGQASGLGGSVQVFSSNNAAFLNSIKNPVATTANFPGVSNPLGISINNAFGRLWPANAPTGLNGPGTSTILDPQGWGLAGAPNANIGGVYSGNLTNRGNFPPSTAQVIPGGLNTGAVGTAFMGASPDGSKKAVFAVVEADGSIVQEHTLQGLDGLAASGTISPLLAGDNDDDGNVTPRLGVVFNWETNSVLNRILYVSEPFQNRIAVINISDNGVVFLASPPTYFTSDALDEPIDLTPVQMETSDLHFSSNTTLDDNSDFYVANRGNNTIVRMTQTGSVVAIRHVRQSDGRDLGNARLNGIATSPDGTTIWLTFTGKLAGQPNSEGGVLEVPAF